MAATEMGPGAPGPHAPDPQAVHRIEQVLDDIDLALHRLEEGTYRSCMQCGEPIPPDRLQEDPTARSCMRHPELSDQEGTDGSTAAGAR